MKNLLMKELEKVVEMEEKRLREELETEDIKVYLYSTQSYKGDIWVVVRYKNSTIYGSQFLVYNEIKEIEDLYVPIERRLELFIDKTLAELKKIDKSFVIDKLGCL